MFSLPAGTPAPADRLTLRRPTGRLKQFHHLYWDSLLVDAPRRTG